MYAKKLVVSQVRAQTQAHIARLQCKKGILETVVKVLESLKGKKVTARIQTIVRQSLSSDFVTHFENSSTGYVTLKVWDSKTIPMHSQMVIYINKLADGTFDYDYFFDTYKETNFGRDIANAEEKLAQVDKLVSDYNAAVDAWELAQNNLQGLSYN